MVPFLSCYSIYCPVESGASQPFTTIEIRTLKCNQESFKYILEALETHGFRVLSLFYNGSGDQLWTINYCQVDESLISQDK